MPRAIAAARLHSSSAPGVACAQPATDQSFLDMPGSGISYLYGATKKGGMTETG